MFTLKKMVKKTVTYSEDYFVVTKYDGNKNLSGIPWWSSGQTWCFHSASPGSIPDQELRSHKPQAWPIKQNGKSPADSPVQPSHKRKKEKASNYMGQSMHFNNK